jgi:hypothetical protein
VSIIEETRVKNNDFVRGREDEFDQPHSFLVGGCLGGLFIRLISIIAFSNLDLFYVIVFSTLYEYLSNVN